MALPALSLLVERGIDVRCFGRAWASELLSGMPLSVVELPRGTLAAAAVLRRSEARHGLLFTNSLRSAAQMRLSGIAGAGYRHSVRGLLLGQAVDRAPAPIHEAQSFWRLAKAVLGEDGDATTAPFARLPLTEHHREPADAALARARVTPGFAVLCPLALGAVRGETKVWPHFAALCSRLMEGGQTVVACPGPGETAATAAALPGAVLLEGLGLGAYAAVLARARYAVANDSGPMHLAASVGAPVIGIFGPGDPARTRPWSERGHAVGGRGRWTPIEEVLGELARLPAPEFR